MVRVIHRVSASDKSKQFVLSPLFLPFVLLITFITSIPVAFFLIQKQQEIRSRATTASTATIQINPSFATFGIGQQFTVEVVLDGGGQAFNAAQAQISVSNNLTVRSMSLVSPSSGGCNFTFINQANSPSVSNPSFDGVILNGSSTHCMLYTLILQGNAQGTGTVTVTNNSVKAYSDNSEIFQSATNGSYTITTNSAPKL